MKIYRYDALSGELLSSSEAIESPLEPGVFLIPAYATDKKPPQAKSGYALCFKEGVWGQVKDERGKTYYDNGGGEVKIEKLGQEKGLLESKPKPKEPSETEARIRELEAGITETQADIAHALILGNDAVLPELREEYKELLSEKEKLQKEVGDGKD